MKVREVISRIPNEPILLLQLCKNRQASAMAEDAMCCVDNQIRILQNLKTFANDMAYLCVHALEPKVFQEKLGISLVMGRGSNFKRGQRLVKTRRTAS